MFVHQKMTQSLILVFPGCSSVRWWHPVLPWFSWVSDHQKTTQSLTLVFPECSSVGWCRPSTTVGHGPSAWSGSSHWRLPVSCAVPLPGRASSSTLQRLPLPVPGCLPLCCQHSRPAVAPIPSEWLPPAQHQHSGITNLLTRGKSVFSNRLIYDDGHDNEKFVKHLPPRLKPLNKHNTHNVHQDGKCYPQFKNANT